MYNGEEITYDGIGNPLSYRGWTMNWQGGRQLAGMTKGSDTLSFAYNESGLRTSKTVNGVTHNYVWHGSKLAADITDAYALYFHYDSSGEVIGFTRTANGTDTEYFYVKNFQGDILKVITATGTEAATYTYDAWGRVLTSTGDIADVNPLRYRGYYYDVETSLYYLQSRYYDPDVERFVNADVYTTTGQGIIEHNMFTYCNNNPVVASDPAGTSGLFILANAVFGAVVGAASQIATNVLTGNPALSGVIGAAVGGAVYNVVALSGNLVAASAAGSAAGSAAEAVTNELGAYISGKKELTSKNLMNSLADVACKTVNGTLTAATTGKLASKIIKTNHNWFQPVKFTSCFTGKYARKVLAQTAIQGTMVTAYNTVKKFVEESIS